MLKQLSFMGLNTCMYSYYKACIVNIQMLTVYGIKEKNGIILMNLGVSAAIQLRVKAGLLEAGFSSLLVVLCFVHLLSSQDVVTKN